MLHYIRKFIFSSLGSRLWSTHKSSDDTICVPCNLRPTHWPTLLLLRLFRPTVANENSMHKRLILVHAKSLFNCSDYWFLN